MPSRHQPTVSPNRPLTVEIPTGLETTMANSGAIERGQLSSGKDCGTEADIKFGERTAFIPMTSQERQVLDRLEAGLQSAAGLWRDSQQQQEHDRLLSSALHHWRAGGSASSGIDTSWVWEVGRWNTQFSLPFALELRRLDPVAMSDSDQLVALSTCLRNRQIELAKKLAAAASASATGPSASTGASGKKKAAAAAPAPPSSLEDLEDEPCLCQIRWGLAPDTEAAKRRQLEKLSDDEQQPQQPHQQHQHRVPSLSQHATKLPQLHHQQQHQPRHQASSLQNPQLPPSAGHRRPIVKTSHLRGPVESAAVAEDAGYSSQSCSPGNKGGSGAGFINDLLTTSAYGGRSWAD